MSRQKSTTSTVSKYDSAIESDDDTPQSVYNTPKGLSVIFNSPRASSTHVNICIHLGLI